MRIDDFLADLEAADAARQRAQLRSDRVDGIRAERALVTLEGRLTASVGSSLSVTLDGGAQKAGRLVYVGAGWLALARYPQPQVVLDVSDLVRPGMCVVALGAVESLTGLGRSHVAVEESAVGRTWTSVLRACGRARTVVTWTTRSGRAHTGVIAAVARDHVVVQGRGGEVTLMTSAVAMLEPAAGRPERGALQAR